MCIRESAELNYFFILLVHTCQVIRKDRAVGVYPGGSQMTSLVPLGHGSKKLKREALDELVMRVTEALRNATDPRPIRLPYCVFNGGTDAWLDVGNKSVGVAVLQAYLGINPAQCLHVGDQVTQHSGGLYSIVR